MKRANAAVRWAAALLAAAIVPAACASRNALPVQAPGAIGIRDVRSLGGISKISHVVVIVQENRSFDNLFPGYPGADTQSYGYTSAGQKIKLAPIPLEVHWDIAHDSTAYFAACNGSGSLPGTNCAMNGFNNEKLTCTNGVHPYCPPDDSQYGYVPRSETKPYFTMAKRYVLGDRMYTSNIDGSYVSHQYIIAGQAARTVDFPSGSLWGCDGGKSDRIATLTDQRAYGPHVRVCFDYTTLGDEMDAAGVSWHYYTSNIYSDGNEWNAYQAIKHVRYGPDWKADVITPQTKFFKDVSNGQLPAVSWVTPTCENSDHASCGTNTGPAWVASLVNAIGESPYWNSTAIFIFWDDWGGWYDHLPPPLADYDGLGIRVPLLIVSPFAKKGYVSHVQYEHGSILRFIEDRFGLARLAASDARANSPEDDAFDFTKKPRAFVPIPSKMNVQDFLRQPLDQRPVDTE